MALDEWNWTIGVVAAPFGVAGEMKVNIETDFPERFGTQGQVCLRAKSGRAELYKTERARPHKGQMLLKLKGIERIEDVDPWRGAVVQIERSSAAPLGLDEYYRTDLVGLEVVTVNGRPIGRIDEVLAYPGHDLYRVGEALIPAVKQIVVEVDLAGGRMVIDPPAGLLPGEEPEHAD